MAGITSTWETKLDEIFVRKAPKLPDGGKKALVEWAPWISLIVGILTLLSAWSLWHWARAVDGLTNYLNTVCNAYGTTSACGVSTSRYSLALWLGVIVLVIEGVLYVAAYSGLKARKKQGWNYLYYGALINVVYAIISLFTDYDKVGHFIGALIGSAIGFYLLFQIRSAYLGKSGRVAPAAPTTPKDTAPKE
ncbi:MAG: hypothetical protein WDN27_03460 [Candidatus Saccharibacteria bacterium]